MLRFLGPATLGFHLICAAAAFEPGLRAQQHSIEIGSFPSCDDVDETRWSTMADWSNRAAVRSLDGEETDGWSAKKLGWLAQAAGKEAGNWASFGGSRRVFCGTQRKFRYYRLRGVERSEEESDWNFFLEPTGESSDLLDVIYNSGRVKPGARTTCSGVPCVEAEITYSDPLRRGLSRPRSAANPWYYIPNVDRTATLESELNGSHVCVYGPLVLENYHGGKPEIHPAEGTWWTERDTTTVIIALDNSARFLEGDFTPTHVDRPAPYYRPWALAPHDLEVAYAGAIPSRFPPYDLTVRILDELLTRTHDEDVPSTYRTRPVTAASQELFRVVLGPGLRWDDVSIPFACSDGDETRAVLAVDTRLYRNYSSAGPASSGYRVLQFSVNLRGQIPVAAEPQAAGATDTTAPGGSDRLVPLVNTLRPGVFQQRRVLEGAFLMDLDSVVHDVTPAWLRSLEFTFIPDSSFDAPPGERETFALQATREDLQSMPYLPLTVGGEAQVTTPDGTLQFEVPRIALDAVLAWEFGDEFSPADDGWNAFVEALELPPEFERPASVMRPAGWTVSVTPGYIETYGDEQQYDPAGFAAAINRDLEANGRLLANLLDSESPIDVEVTFEQGEQAIEGRPAPASPPTVAYEIPATGDDRPVQVTAVVRDELDQVASRTEQLPSLGLRGASAEALTDLLVRFLAGVAQSPATELERAIAFAPRSAFPELTDRRVTRLKILADALLTATADNFVTLAEMRGLVNVARRLRVAS